MKRLMRSLAFIALISCASALGCDYEGLRCVTLDGTVVEDACTEYYATCLSTHVQSAPIHVKYPTVNSCYKGYIIPSTTCPAPITKQCDYTGVRCTDKQGHERNNTCTHYYVECNNGVLSSVYEAPNNQKCINGRFVAAGACKPDQCNFDDIRCATSDGTIVHTYCTNYYVECDNGQISDPIAVADGTQCLASQIVLSEQCAQPTCAFSGIRCCDALGELQWKTCSDYFVECVDGYYTKPIHAATGTKCYHNSVIGESLCPGTNKCDLDRNEIVCCDRSGIFADTNECTNFYEKCVNGKYTEPIHVAAGKKCLNGQEVGEASCASPICEGDELLCTDAEGNWSVNVCTGYFMECADGVYEPPQEVAAGTACLDGEIINSVDCGVPPYECDFEGVKCSDSDGNILYNQCTQNYVQCDHGFVTEPHATQPGISCYNSLLIPSGNCATGCVDGSITCTNFFSEPVKNRCTRWYLGCDNNTYTGPFAVAIDERCINGILVQSDSCTDLPTVTPTPTTPPTPTVPPTALPICGTDSLTCVNILGDEVKGHCTHYYSECKDHVQYPKRHCAPGTRCKDGKIILSNECRHKEKCSFGDEIHCVTPLGKEVKKGVCTHHYAMCINGYTTHPIRTDPGTRCLNDAEVIASECTFGEKCNYPITEIHCCDSEGVELADTCTKYFEKCINGRTTRPHPTPRHVSCYNNHLIFDNFCPASETCSFEGIICTNAEGVFNALTCTQHYVVCDNGEVSVPMDVAEGTYCLQGEIVLPSQCEDTTCTFSDTEIRCSNKEGVLVTDKCTGYYLQCEDGVLTDPLPVADGTKCLNDAIVNKSTCGGSSEKCKWETQIRCTDSTGLKVKDVCTDNYIMCDNGMVTDPSPVAEGTKCLNNELVMPYACEGTAVCDFTDIRCVNEDSVFQEDICTDYYVMCEAGVITEKQPVSAGSKCYKNKQVTVQQCPVTPIVDVECTFEGIKCVNEHKVFLEPNVCSRYYVMCENGELSNKMKVAAKTRCMNDEQVLPQRCVDGCDFEGIKCSDKHGDINEFKCTDYYVQCSDGTVTEPSKVAAGTQCKRGELVQASTCAIPTCNWTDDLHCCTHSGFEVGEGVCTNYFHQCVGGKVTKPTRVAPGTKCLNDTQVLQSECKRHKCRYSNLQCVDSTGAHQHKVCTDYYKQCISGYETDTQSVPAGSKCYKGKLIASSDCVPPECDYDGIRCTDYQGVETSDTCTFYYEVCDNGHETEPQECPEGTMCFQNDIILESQCVPPLCNFEGIVCCDKKGEVMTDTCTEYFEQCENGTYTDPMKVVEGTRCYNKEIVSVTDDQCAITTECNFDGIKCSNMRGNIVRGHCTDFFVQCDQGKKTDPIATSEGTKCLNGEQVEPSSCENIECNFEGIVCVDSCDNYVTGYCTHQYMECKAGKLKKKKLTDLTKVCLNSEIVDATDGNCVFEYEVVESESTGLRGRSAVVCQ